MVAVLGVTGRRAVVMTWRGVMMTLVGVMVVGVVVMMMVMMNVDIFGVLGLGGGEGRVGGLLARGGGVPGRGVVWKRKERCENQ